MVLINVFDHSRRQSYHNDIGAFSAHWSPPGCPAWQMNGHDWDHSHKGWMKKDCSTWYWGIMAISLSGQVEIIPESSILCQK
jgi:hypothetical protein